MAISAPNKNPERSPKVLSIKIDYEGVQQQLEVAVKSMTQEQILALLLLIFGLALLKELFPQVAAEIEEDEQGFAWNYLSALQAQLPKDKPLSDLFREANIQLVVNDRPIELGSLAPSGDDELGDPFENFKQGWDDAMNGRTMSYEEFERRMLEDAD